MTNETHTYKIAIPLALTVNKRDGSSVEVDVAQIPEEFFADFVTDGIAEYIRDSSSAALANAYDLAHPDHKLEGKALRDARSAWVMDNVPALAAESEALMTAARDRLYNGERRVASMSNVDPLDQWRIKVLRQVMRTETGAAMKSKHDAINSADQAARRAFLLDVAAKQRPSVTPPPRPPRRSPRPLSPLSCDAIGPAD
jgi:hypothetical protein